MPVRKWRVFSLAVLVPMVMVLLPLYCRRPRLPLFQKSPGSRWRLPELSVKRSSFYGRKGPPTLFRPAKLDFLKALSSLNGCGYRACHIAHVQLRNGFARAFPDIAHVDADDDRISFLLYRKAGIVKLGIAQPVAERKERGRGGRTHSRDRVPDMFRALCSILGRRADGCRQPEGVRQFGPNDTGRCPDGLVLPKIMSAIDSPARSPAYHCSSMAGIFSFSQLME